MYYINTAKSFGTSLSMQLIHNEGLRYYLASKGDIDIIFDIFSRAFNHSLRWKMKIYSKFWLSFVLDNPSCKIWLAKTKSTPVGVLMLVSDYDQFLKIKKNKWVRVYWLISLFYPPLSIYAVKRFIQKRNSKENEEVTLQLVFNKTEKRKALSIEQLAVIPEIQGQGYGDKIVKFAKYIALKDHYNILTLSVNKYNAPAYHLYLRNEFAEV